MSWIPSAFQDLPDPRTRDATRLDPPDIVIIALAASICGAKNCYDFADFAMDPRSLFQGFPRLKNDPPSHDTVSRAFRPLDPTAFATCFGRFLEGLSVASEGVVAIDSDDAASIVRQLGARQSAGCRDRLRLGHAPGDRPGELPCGRR